MKKITIISAYLTTIFILSGCVSVNPTGKLVAALGNPTIKMTEKAKKEAQEQVEKEGREIKLTEKEKKEAAEAEAKKQKNKENICGFSHSGSLSQPIKELLENSMIQDFKSNLSAFRALVQKPISPEIILYLDKSEFGALIPKLISPENILDLNKSEFWLTIRQPAGFMGAGGFLAAINRLSNELLEKPTSGHEFEEMLRFYLLNYIDGKFVLRNGTKLAKPSGSITHEKIQTDKGEKGIVSASLEKSTVTGLTTVILEAIFDYCLETPAYAYADKKKRPIYEPEYLEIAGHSGKFNLVYQGKDPIDDYLFDDAIIPTATMFNIKLRSDLKEDCNKEICKMTANDIKRIRRVSDFSAETTTAVVGAAFKSLGGAGLSAFGFFKFSFGDNDSINQIVEAATSVTTRRKTEHLLYELIENGESYDCGNKGTDTCSEKVKKLLEKFDYHTYL